MEVKNITIESVDSSWVCPYDESHSHTATGYAFSKAGSVILYCAPDGLTTRPNNRTILIKLASAPTADEYVRKTWGREPPRKSLQERAREKDNQRDGW